MRSAEMLGTANLVSQHEQTEGVNAFEQPDSAFLRFPGRDELGHRVGDIGPWHRCIQPERWY